MGLSKPQELGMSAFRTSLLRRLHHWEGWHHTIHQEAWWAYLHLSSICWWYHLWIIKWRLMQRIWWIDVEGVRGVNDWCAYILSFQVKQMKEGIFISQEKYTKDLLKRFKMDECKPIKTPMPTNGHLDLDEGGNSVDQTLYRSMIGSLLYLTASRPDIMFSVCMCARFQASPKETHLIAVKRILRYLKHTPSIGLWYPKELYLN